MTKSLQNVKNDDNAVRTLTGLIEKQHQQAQVISADNVQDFILPVPYYYLTVFTHTGYNVAEFTVTVSRLVQVHEVHIHGIPRNFFVELNMEVQQRLLQFLQTVNPHLL